MRATADRTSSFSIDPDKRYSAIYAAFCRSSMANLALPTGADISEMYFSIESVYVPCSSDNEALSDMILYISLLDGSKTDDCITAILSSLKNSFSGTYDVSSGAGFTTIIINEFETGYKFFELSG